MQCKTKKCFSTFTKGECVFSLVRNTVPANFVIDDSEVVILIFFCLFIMLKIGFRYPEIEDEKIKGYVA